jgi:hypothetical protein
MYLHVCIAIYIRRTYTHSHMIAATPAQHQAQQNQAHPPAAYVGAGSSIHHPAGMPPHQQQGPPHGGPVRPWHQNGDPSTSMVRPRPVHALLAVSRAVSGQPDARMVWDQGPGGLGGRGGPGGQGAGGICVSRCILARFSRICARAARARRQLTPLPHTQTHTNTCVRACVCTCMMTSSSLPHPLAPSLPLRRRKCSNKSHSERGWEQRWVGGERCGKEREPSLSRSTLS